MLLYEYLKIAAFSRGITMYRTDTIKIILMPENILVPLGYKIEVFAVMFTTPINLTL